MTPATIKDAILFTFWTAVWAVILIAPWLLF
jgi:hypothetical protein